MQYYQAITDGEYFTAGKFYPVLDYMEDGGIITADDDNKEHALSAVYLAEHFRKEGADATSDVHQIFREIALHKAKGVPVLISDGTETREVLSVEIDTDFRLFTVQTDCGVWHVLFEFLFDRLNGWSGALYHDGYYIAPVFWHEK